jgi:hypothetical protein
MSREANRKVSATRNYRLFGRNDDNRPLNIKKHKKLEKSMKQYGFLACFPIVCVRDASKNLIVKDGQHRLAIAETLGLPVYWIEETVDFDVAIINCTAKTWVLRDYAQKWANGGRKSYQECIEFADIHNLPIGTAAALLAGTTSFGNIDADFTDGVFKVKDRKWADSVAAIYGPLTQMVPATKNARFIEACMAVCRVAEFDGERLVSNARRCRDKLAAYSTRDAYLQMLEDIYNFGRSRIFALKIEATKVMRERNVANGKKAQNDPPAADVA